MKSTFVLACIFFVFGQFAAADQITRQNVGVARATPAEAAMDLIKVCLGSPLIEAKIATFEGIENLEFTELPKDIAHRTFASGTCVFKAVTGS